MKKLGVFLIVFCASMQLFAQNKQKVNLLYQFNYQLNKSGENFKKIEVYYSDNEGLLVKDDNHKFEFLNSLGVFRGYLDYFSNNFEEINYFFELGALKNIVFSKEEKIVIHNKSYQKYTLKINSSEKIFILMDESNSINMLNFLEKMGYRDYPKGVLYSVGEIDADGNENGEKIILDSIKKIENNFFYYDVDRLKEIVKNHENQEETVMVADSTTAEATIDAAAPDSAIMAIPIYISKYKKTKTHKFSFQELNKEDYYWDALPSYCKNLGNGLGQLKNKELKKHLMNYAGQVCEMYYVNISPFYYASNYQDELDVLRKENLLIWLQLEKLSKEEKTLVIKYLNQLD